MLLLCAAAILYPQAVDAQDGKEPPRVELERPQFFVFRDGLVLGTITGKIGTTRPDGRVQLEGALFKIYPEAVRSESPSSDPSADGKRDGQAAKRQVMLVAGAGLMVWTRASSVIEVSSDFWLSYLPTDDVSGLDGRTGGSDLVDSKIPAGLVTISGISAKLSWESTKENGLLKLTDGNNIKLGGFDIKASATRMTVDIVTKPVAAEDLASNKALTLSDVKTITIGAPDGLDVVLPKDIGLNDLAGSKRISGGETDFERIRIALVSNVELKVEEAKPDQAIRRVTFKGSGGSRVMPPGSELPMLSSTELDALAHVVTTQVPDPEDEKKLIDKHSFVPLWIKLKDRAAAKVLNASGTAKEILVEFFPDGSQKISLLVAPSIFGSSGSSLSSSENRVDDFSANLDLTATDSISVLLSDSLWVVECVTGVRARITFQTGHSIGVAGDSLVLKLNPPSDTNDGSEASKIRGMSRLTPDDVRSLVSEGTGVLPRVAFFERPIGKQVGERRLALFANKVNVVRRGKGFDLEATGQELRMSMELPVSASAMINEMLHPSAQFSSPSETTAAAARLASIPATYEIATSVILSARVEGIGTEGLTGDDIGLISIRTTEDTLVDEYPEKGDVRGHVSAGRLDARIQFLPFAPKSPSSPARPSDMRLSNASFNYSPAEATGFARIVTGSDIIEANRIEVNYSGSIVFADLRGPLVIAARGKEATRAIMDVSILTSSEDGAGTQANQAMLTTPGDFRLNMTLDEALRPISIETFITREVRIEYANSSSISIASGRTALEEWLRTRDRAEKLLLTMTASSLKGDWRSITVQDRTSRVSAVEARGPTSAVSHVSGARFSGGTMLFQERAGGHLVTIQGPASAKLPGPAASMLMGSLQESRSVAAKSAPTPRVDPTNPIPAAPAAKEAEKGSRDPASRYPGGVVLTTEEGAITLVYSTTTRTIRDAETQDGVLTLIAKNRVNIVGYGPEQKPLDAVSGDVLEASIWDTQDQESDKFGRIRDFALSGNVDVQAEDGNLSGDRLVYDPMLKEFRVEGTKLGVGLDEKVEISGLSGITVVPAAATPSSDAPKRDTDLVGPSVRATGKKIEIKVKSGDEKKDATPNTKGASRGSDGKGSSSDKPTSDSKTDPTKGLPHDPQSK